MIFSKKSMGLTFLLSGTLFWSMAFGASVFSEEMPSENYQKATPLFNAANGLMDNGMYELAREEWEKFLSEYPMDTRILVARHQLGVCLFQENEYEKARILFDEVQAADKNFRMRDQTLYLKGLCIFEMAKKVTQDISEKKKSEIKEDVEKRPVSEHDEEIKGEKRNEGEDVKEEGVLSSHSGQRFYSQAVQTFQVLLAEYPKTRYKTEAVFYLGVCFRQLGRTEEAKRAFSDVIVTRSASAEVTLLAFYASAEIAAGQRQFREAEQILNRLLTFYRQNEGNFNKNDRQIKYLRLQALCLRASVILQMKNYSEAQKTFDSLFRDKEFQEAENLQATGKDDYLEYGVDIPMIHYSYADTLLKLRRYTEAEEKFRKFRERFPESILLGRALYQQAQAMIRENNVCKNAKVILKHDPQMIHQLLEETFQTPAIMEDVSLCNAAGHQLMVTYLERKDVESAERILNRVMEINEAHHLSLTHILEKDRADILVLLSKIDEAITIYKKLAEQFRNNEKMLEWMAFSAYQVIYLLGKEQRYQEALQYAQDMMEEEHFCNMPEMIRKAIQQEVAGCAYRVKNFTESGRIYTDLLKRYPADPQAEQWILLVAHGLQLEEKDEDTIQFLDVRINKMFSSSLAVVEAKHILAYSLLRMSKKLPKEEISKYQERARTVFSSAIRQMQSLKEEECYSRGDVLCYDYAGLLLDLKKYDTCESCLRYILKRFSQSEIMDQVYFLLGRCAVEENNPQKAVHAFREIIEKYPESSLRPDALLAISQCMLNLGEVRLAQKYAEQFVQNFPKNRLVDMAINVQAAAAMNVGDYDVAISAWEKVLRSEMEELKDLRYDALYGLGFCKMQKQEYEAAETFFRQLLKENALWKAGDKVLYQIGWTLMKQNKPDEAREFFETLTEKFPESELVREARYQLAVNFYRNGKVVQAETIFQELIRENAEDIIALNARLPLAWMFFKQKKYQKAKEYALSVLESMEKTESEAEVTDVKEENRAELQFLLGQSEYFLSDWSAAEKYLTLSLQGGYLNKSYCEDALLAIIKVYEVQENWPKLQQKCEEYTQKYPKSSQVTLIQYKTALALLNQEKLAEAEKLFRKIVDEDQGIHAARSLFMLGEIQFSRKDFTGAIKTFYQVMYGFQDAVLQADAYYECARCFEVLGQKEKAASHFQQLMEKFPQSDKAEIAKKKMRILNRDRTKSEAL
ncbi:MAG: tetratricopeptide repeat protein [Planctomycetia bacterium]|nr:tetratricopeptide repeat protein [Planctomycetia bacterium]